MPEFHFTFGVQYAHEPHPCEVDGVVPHPDGYWTVVAPGEDAARAKINSLIGDRWAFSYPSAHFNAHYYPKGEMLRIIAE